MPTLLLFALATLLLTATPGPAVLYVTARTMAQGRRAGFASMLGIEAGEVFWIGCAATGVTALFFAATTTLSVLRFAGAAYLILLGIQRWRSTDAVVLPAKATPGKIFAQGFVTQVLNPKVAAFFVALLPQFLNPMYPIGRQMIMLGAVYVVIAIAVDLCYVLVSSAISQRLLASRAAQRRIGRISAATYVALGLTAAATGSRPAT